MSTSSPAPSTQILFVDLDNPPASINLFLGQGIALIRQEGLCGAGIYQLDVPASDFVAAAVMFTTAPMQPLPGQPADTYVQYIGSAQNSGTGKITFVSGALVPNPTAGTSHSIDYTIA
jgi:hypothetical protein